MHPRLDTTVNGQTAVRYLRFGRPARLDRLELCAQSCMAAGCRMCPPTRRTCSSRFCDAPGAWRVVREVDLPFDPRIAGEGLIAGDEHRGR